MTGVFTVCGLEFNWLALMNQFFLGISFGAGLLLMFILFVLFVNSDKRTKKGLNDD